MSLGAFQDTLRMTTSFPFHGRNISNMFTYFHQLSTEDQSQLLKHIGISKVKELQAIFFRNRMDLDQFPSTEYRIHKILAIYVPPILLLLGTFGNIFAFLVLRHKSMARVTTYLFLAALSISDCFVLLFGLLRMWIGEISKFELRDQSDWLCKSIIYIGYLTSNFSAWLLIAVTIERYLVIVHPFKALVFCSVARAKKIMLGICLFFMVVNFHFFWTVGLHRPSDGEPLKCDSSPEHRFLIYIIWPWVDALFYSFLPFILILVFNILIIFRVLQSNNGKEMEHTSTLRRFSGRRCSTTSSNYRLTIMLLSVSLTFVFTTLPMNIGIICSFLWNQQLSDINAMSKFRLFMTIAELLMYLNHSINFFLYCATGQNFRNEIKNMVCLKFRHRPNPNHSQHLYCSRGCSIASGNTIVRKKSVLETEV